MKILLFVLALWAFMSIAPSDGKDVLRYYGKKGTICKQGNHWIVKIKCTNKCKIHKPKAAFERGGRVRITGRMGKAFRQKKKLCGRNCFCAKTSKPKWNQVFCKNHKGKKITSNRVHFDIWCIKRTTKLRFRAYVKNIGKPKMMEKKCPSGQIKHEDGVCRECANKEYKDGTCKACACDANGAKFQSCETGSGDCKCKIGYKDKKCNQCDDEYYKKTGEQDCKACLCDPRGSNGLTCTPGDGKCTCKPDVNAATKCDTCNNGALILHDDGKCRECENGKYKQGGTCKDCNCGTEGSKFQTCEATSGQCDCKDGYEGRDCKTCKDKFYKITATGECKACGCGNGAQNGGNCGDDSGDCTCISNFKPPKCSRCKDGYYKDHMSNQCNSCDCETANTKGGDIRCDRNGRCNCATGFSGLVCSMGSG